MTQEQDKFMRMVCELQEIMTVEAIAIELGVEPRQVWRWKSGADRPSGINAINLYLFHMKRCPQGQSPISHSAGNS